MELDLKKAKNSVIHFELYPYPQIRAPGRETRNAEFDLIADG
jgi:hypothetical protein